MFNMSGIADVMKNIEKYGAVFEQSLVLIKELRVIANAHCEALELAREEISELRDEIRQLREGK